MKQRGKRAAQHKDADNAPVAANAPRTRNATAPGGEKGQLDWPGRTAAVTAALTPPRAQLSEPCATSGHVLLEGDNLDALKLLQNEYAGQVKLIYIDPPYNTGNTFVYNDTFGAKPATRVAAENLAASVARLCHTPDPGEFAGHHGEWLNMMAPRLLLARQLLRADGIIVISIDAGELAALTLLLDQIFGPENALGNIVWVSNLKGRQLGSGGPRRTHEYLCVYARDAHKAAAFAASAQKLETLMPQVYKKVTYPVQRDARGPYVTKNQLYNTNSRFNERTARSMVYAIDYHPESGAVRTRDIDLASGTAVGQAPAADWVTLMPHPNHREGLRFHAWRWSRSRVEENAEELEFRRDRRGAWRVYTKVRECERVGMKDLVIGPSTLTGMDDLAQLGLADHFSYPKPVALIQLLVEAASSENDIVLDFFAGSGTTAQAVVAQNTADGGARRALLVQLPEPYEHGDFRTLADVTRARLRAAGIEFQDLPLVAARA